MDVSEIKPNSAILLGTAFAHNLTALHTQLTRVEQLTKEAIAKVYGKPAVLTERARIVSQLTNDLIPEMDMMNEGGTPTGRSFTVLTQTMRNVIAQGNLEPQLYTPSSFGGTTEELLTAKIAASELEMLDRKAMRCAKALEGQHEYAAVQRELENRNVPNILTSIQRLAGALKQNLLGAEGATLDKLQHDLVQYQTIARAGANIAGTKKEIESDTPATVDPATYDALKARLEHKLRGQNIFQFESTKGPAIAIGGNGLEILERMFENARIQIEPCKNAENGQKMLRVRSAFKDIVLSLMPDGFKLENQPKANVVIPEVVEAKPLPTPAKPPARSPNGAPQPQNHSR